MVLNFNNPGEESSAESTSVTSVKGERVPKTDPNCQHSTCVEIDTASNTSSMVDLLHDNLEVEKCRAHA